MCEYYCQTSELVTTEQRNVSGGLVRYRKWSKHRCALKQEDKYPRHCNFKLDQKKQDELNKRYPDLAATYARLVEAEKRVQCLMKELV